MMQFVGGKLVVRTLSIIAIVTLSLTSVAYAQSKAVRVYKDEYIVHLKTSAASISSSRVSISGLVSAKDLGESSTKLFRSATAAASINGVASTSSVVPYEPAKSKCPELLKSGLVSSCSPNYEVSVSATTSNDPVNLDRLWGLTAESGIDAPAAWDVTTGSNSVIAAIIDTGADYNHQDLAQNIWTNPSEIPGNGIDDDHNGYIDDVHGINAATGTGNPMDDNGHGTHVAGTIGGVGNNGVGVVGVNWHVKIMPLKFLNSSGSGSLADAITAINYMVMMKNRGVNIKVVNNSWGGGGYSDSLLQAITRVRDAGIIFTAAAGNEANDNDSNQSYPASYEVDNVVSVAAIDVDGNLASFSNYGATSVGIAAPGVNIYSTLPGNSYGALSGTSMATPHVTGAIALLFSHEPSLTPQEAITRLYESGSPLSTLTDVVRTGRKLNVGRMVLNQTEALPPVAAPSTCQYAVEEVSYNPDRSADNRAIVLQADEYNFYKVNLPFLFPFHGATVSSIIVSPNGVVYLKRAPGAADYSPASKAPSNSIAALQADLIATADPYGVRVYSDSDHVTIYWRAKAYGHQNNGDILVRLSLYPDGTIQDAVEFGDAAALTAVKSAATIGINGPISSSAYTFASSDSSIHNRLGVKFTPLCVDNGDGDNTQPVINKVSVNGYYSSGNLSSRVRRGQSFITAVSGTGSGQISLKLSLNGQQCPGAYIANFSDGATVLGKLPRVPKELTKLTAIVSSRKDSAPIARAKSTTKVSAKRISARKLSNYCTQMISSLSQ